MPLPRGDLPAGLSLSASDLIAGVQCRHLAWRALEVKAGRLERPDQTASAELVARKGIEHEQAYLDGLVAAGGRVVTIDSHGDRDAAVVATIDAMRSGAEVIYQAVFDSPPWRGHADFLERVEVPSELGAHSYQVADTKLARSSKPGALIQLWLYSSLMAEIQGHNGGEVHLILGDGRRESFPIDRYAAYCRHLAATFVGEVGEGALEAAYPEPVSHCQVCEWSDVCDARRVADDHLSLIPSLNRGQAKRLRDQGIDTVAALAEAVDDQRPLRMQPSTFAAHRHHARLQVEARPTDGSHRFERIPADPGRGLERLPPPDDGDLFFDIEGDPWVGEDGLEYLFGLIDPMNAANPFVAIWATDPSREKKAFEELVDYICARRAERPGMHVYHYAPYEKTALRKLMSRYGTREEEVDDLLRNEVLVDLYPVVTQSMRTSLPSYSIKKIEEFYFSRRRAGVSDGGDSIVQFEAWMETGEESILEDIAAYNEEDCVSTRELRDWLLSLDPEAGTRPLREKPPPEPEPEHEPRVAALIERSGEDATGDPDAVTPDQHEAWLLANLLEYHRREEKPAWWAYFTRLEMDERELTEDTEALAGITWDLDQEPVKVARSLEYVGRFPAQEHRLKPGGATDPFTEAGIPVTGIDDAAGTIRVKLGPSRSVDDLPRALIPGTPIGHRAHQAALGEIADTFLADAPSFPAARDILANRAPRLRDHGGPIVPDGASVAEISDAIAALDESYMVVQGPPGAGKTYTSGRVLVDLMQAGRRVGVAGPSHKAIHNLLHEVEEVAHERGFAFRGIKKANRDSEGSIFVSRLDEPFIDSSEKDADAEGVQLIAGTSWFFAKRRQDVDVLLVDEAGQIALADALAMAVAATNVVLVGDPMQLPQVAQGVHPPGVGGSALEHLLQGESTVRPERGIFLGTTRRLHPEICAYISEIAYDGRLTAAPECADQYVTSPGLTGSGLRFIEVEHDGNARRSPEEAERIAQEIGHLIGGRVAVKGDPERELRPADIMVVAPYNAQVREISGRVPEGVRVGTIDKFQGQEAAVVFISMATSSGEDAPRNLEFLLSINRLNVAVSRARCQAVGLACRALLHTPCRSIHQLELASALVRLAHWPYEAADRA